MSIPERLKAARSALGLTQKEVAEQSGVSTRGYQGYEDGRSVPGGEAISGFVKLGINANWLLTGEGPMLLADLMTPATPPVVHTPINMGAMAALLQGAVGLVNQGMSAEKACRLAVETYQRAMDAGEITPTGIGEGKHGKAA